MCSSDDVREHDDAGREHVRRVVAPAEAGLDDRRVDRARGELGEGRGGEHLELGRAGRVRVGPGASAASRSASSPSTWIRSDQARTWGEM